MDWRTDLLTRADAYCKATGRARSGLGAMIMNDPKFFDEIENGRSCTVDTLVKIKDWLKENAPKKSRNGKGQRP